MEQWEYMVLWVADSKVYKVDNKYTDKRNFILRTYFNKSPLLTNFLRDRGAEGWEIASSNTAYSNPHYAGAAYELILRRQKV